jgi:CheY-like chemotaxis protein
MASILLVDDDDGFRTMLSEGLRRADYQVLEASDGQEGIKLYGIHPTDLVITDLVMPGREGLDMILELKRLYPGSKIIAISGGTLPGSETNLNMAKAFGARRVLTKPFSHGEILEAISQVLQEA